MHRIIVFVLAISFVSCTKEYTTNYEAFVKNSSKHSITVLPYKNGMVRNTDTIALLPNQSFRIAKGFRRGTSGNIGFSSSFWQPLRLV